MLAAVAAVAIEYLPASQSVQLLFPLILYLPDEQAKHGPPSGPENPALQIQLVNAAAPLRDSVSFGQGKHLLLVLAPTDVEYVFSPQLTHAALLVAFVTALHVPARQSMHPDPAVEYLPAAHTPHVARLLAPAAAPVPAAQSRHWSPLIKFEVVENVPARQSRHPEPTVENFPAPHTPHAARLLAPAVAPVPAEQLRHMTLLVAPGVVENVPARQSRHPEPVVANFPAAQTPHAARLPAPAAAPVPAAQSRQAPLLVAPVVPEYLPPAQSMQVLALAVEYLPALQLEQELAPVTRVPSQAYIIFFAMSNSGLRLFCQPGKNRPMNSQPDRSPLSLISKAQLNRFPQLVGSPYSNAFQTSW